MADEKQEDFLDRLVIFLAKRDGIDKLVKTVQYVSKLLQWHLHRKGKHALAVRTKSLDVAAGLSRKAFRLGRWLSGVNNIRKPQTSTLFRTLATLGNAGEVIYFFFDHFTWLARVGFLDPVIASKFSFMSASGEAFGYVFFVIADLILIWQGLVAERRLLVEIETLEESRGSKSDTEPKLGQQIQQKRSSVSVIRMKRVMQAMGIAANVADFVIALQDIRPNPFVTHSVTLGVCGLVSAWAGWYRNWPESK